jgi:hypothetical protein
MLHRRAFGIDAGHREVAIEPVDSNSAHCIVRCLTSSLAVCLMRPVRPRPSHHRCASVVPTAPDLRALEGRLDRREEAVRPARTRRQEAIREGDGGLQGARRRSRRRRGAGQEGPCNATPRFCMPRCARRRMRAYPLRYSSASARLCCSLFLRIFLSSCLACVSSVLYYRRRRRRPRRPLPPSLRTRRSLARSPTKRALSVYAWSRSRRSPLESLF